MQNAEHMDVIDKAEWARCKRVIAECRKMQHRIRARLHARAKAAAKRAKGNTHD